MQRPKFSKKVKFSKNKKDQIKGTHIKAKFKKKNFKHLKRYINFCDRPIMVTFSFFYLK